MRGTPAIHIIPEILFGIIPAYAGNTRMLRHRRLACRDHPRVCGEHDVGRYKWVELTGSSPRMRGTRGSIQIIHARTGIIPAYAGNTPTMIITARTLRDHPRVCGEHTLSGIAERTGLGSSPRMRGTPP